jgi:hypothetical protein
MTAPNVSEANSSLASQCLALRQTLARDGQAFSFSLTVGSTFTFSLDTRKTAPPPQARKKPSPSTLRQNAKRRKKFLEAEEAVLSSTDPESTLDNKPEQCEAPKVNTPKCDVCDYKCETNVRLKIHMSRKYNDIQQLDGDIFYSKRETDYYWEKKYFSSLKVFLIYKEVLMDIKESYLNEDEKAVEYEKATNARKEALGHNFSLFPPWNT